jgi:hypothetical protein
MAVACRHFQFHTPGSVGTLDSVAFLISSRNSRGKSFQEYFRQFPKCETLPICISFSVDTTICPIPEGFPRFVRQNRPTCFSHGTAMIFIGDTRRIRISHTWQLYACIHSEESGLGTVIRPKSYIFLLDYPSPGGWAIVIKRGEKAKLSSPCHRWSLQCAKYRAIRELLIG